MTFLILTACTMFMRQPTAREFCRDSGGQIVVQYDPALIDVDAVTALIAEADGEVTCVAEEHHRVVFRPGYGWCCRFAIGELNEAWPPSVYVQFKRVAVADPCGGLFAYSY